MMNMRVRHYESDNIEIVINIEEDEVIKKLIKNQKNVKKVKKLSKILKKYKITAIDER